MIQSQLFFETAVAVLQHTHTHTHTHTFTHKHTPPKLVRLIITFLYSGRGVCVFMHVCVFEQERFLVQKLFGISPVGTL